MVAADTRISQGYSILDRNFSKMTQLTDNCIICSAGMASDVMTFHKHIAMKVKIFTREHKRQPDIEEIANLISRTLYSRRFMPYYSFNIVAGLKADGTGICYNYDAIGSYDSVVCSSQGSGQYLAAPLIDTMFQEHNHMKSVLSTDRANVDQCVQEIIHSVAESDIYTGDGIKIAVLDKTGVTFRTEKVRRD